MLRAIATAFRSANRAIAAGARDAPQSNVSRTSVPPGTSSNSHRQTFPLTCVQAIRRPSSNATTRFRTR